MRIPLSWLRTYCDPGLDGEAIAELLTASGTELERLERIGVPDESGFVIGKVLAAEPHPDADRLRVCRVDVGDGGRTIVCGAPNVAAGQTVAVALPGAVLPDGTKLGTVGLRGITSNGMILAEDELGFGEDHAGIMVLDDDLLAGAPLAAGLPISDEVIEVEVNPNRPDCMSVYGIARELHALTDAPLAEDPATADSEPTGEPSVDELVGVEIADPDICLRFTARAFESVSVGPSPPWLRQRLSAAGQRPISNVVDITNYVMLLTGQPLHAFDLGAVAGPRIIVRRAHEGERMITLDGIERTLDPEIAVVCDAERPSGIAGVMGGQVSEVGSGTTRVLMEAATWVGPNILATSKRLGLRSEASARFERQLHPDLAIAAQRLAARLMVDLCGARQLPGTIDAYPVPPPARTATLRPKRMARLLGAEIPADETTAILTRLGFSVGTVDGALETIVPSWRDGDVRREADLIEEVARIYGLDRLPATLPARPEAVGRRSRSDRLRARAEDALREQGLSETVSYSFTSQSALGRLGLHGDALRIANPMNEEQAVMRPTLLTGLLDALATNFARGESDVALFESARVFEPGAGDRPHPDSSPGGALAARERTMLGAITTVARAASWRSPRLAADFYSARGLLDAVTAVYGVAVELSETASGEWPFLHPARSATVALAGGGEVLGWVGELHPLVVRAWDFPAGAGEVAVGGFEVDLDRLAAATAGPPPYTEVNAFPAVRQDIAVVVDERQSAGAVIEAVRAGGGELLRSVEVFDLFRGEQVGQGRKSLALGLEFRAPDRTLTDDEVAQKRDAIAASLAEIGAGLRG